MSRTVSVPAYRSTVETAPGGVALTIPARRNYFIVAFLLVWMCGWFMGEITTLHKLIEGDTRGNGAFLTFWLAGWTVGGIFVVVSLFWILAGRERVVFSRSDVSLRKEVFGLGLTKRYEPAQVKNLRAVESLPGPFGMAGRDPFGWSSGTLAFDYGAKTIRFGGGIDSAEATYLAEKITAASPGLRRSTDCSS